MTTLKNNTNTPAQIDLADHLDSLKLSLEYIQMLEAVLNDSMKSLCIASPHIASYLQQPIAIRLGMGQLLAGDFANSLQSDIDKLEGKA